VAEWVALKPEKGQDGRLQLALRQSPPGVLGPSLFFRSCPHEQELAQLRGDSDENFPTKAELREAREVCKMAFDCIE